MTDKQADKQPGASTRTSRVIKASAEALYDAFLDPDELVVWLPPADMTGKMHAFAAGVGGGYRMSLFYPPADDGHRGKTSANEDMVDVRFVELVPPRKIVEAVSFVTSDPAMMGVMTITITFAAVAGGTEVIFLCENLQPGLRPEDNEVGTRFTLEQLARRFEA